MVHFSVIDGNKQVVTYRCWVRIEHLLNDKDMESFLSHFSPIFISRFALLWTPQGAIQDFSSTCSISFLFPFWVVVRTVRTVRTDNSSFQPNGRTMTMIGMLQLMSWRPPGPYRIWHTPQADVTEEQSSSPPFIPFTSSLLALFWASSALPATHPRPTTVCSISHPHKLYWQLLPASSLHRRQASWYFPSFHGTFTYIPSLRPLARFSSILSFERPALTAFWSICCLVVILRGLRRGMERFRWPFSLDFLFRGLKQWCCWCCCDRERAVLMEFLAQKR